MEEKKIIYLVTSGCYSDYMVERVFSTRELAETYVDAECVSRGAEIEEYPLDEPVKRRMSLRRIRIRMKDKYTKVADPNELRSRVDTFTFVDGESGDSYIDFVIESDSSERAIKIASERFGAVIANEQVCYPFLRTRIVEQYRQTRYPHYNFNNGNIVLFDDQHLAQTMPEWVKTEHRKKIEGTKTRKT